jgi:hypothetical protein
MGKIMDFLKGTKDSELAVNTTKYTFYETYPTQHRAEVYALTLKRAGKQTRVVEKGDEWQVWWRD